MKHKFNIKWKKLIPAFYIATLSSVVFSILFVFGFFASWQDRASDSLFLSHEPNTNVVIIAIDDKSIQSIGRFPWNRDVYTQLLERLNKKPAVIGIDISFPEKSTTLSDLNFSKQIAANGNVVLPITARTLRTSGNSVIANDVLFPVEPLNSVSKKGIVNMLSDPDGVTRFTPIHIETGNSQKIDNFSVEILRLFYSQLGLPTASNTLNSLPTSNGFLRINYSGRPGSYPTYSFIDVLDGTIPLEKFERKIVLIGATALDLHDDELTPVSFGVKMSGVEIHANVLRTILEGKYIYEEPQLNTIITIVLLALGSSVIFSFFGIFSGAFFFFLLCITYIVYAIISFDGGQIRNLIFPLFTIIAVYISQALYKYHFENKQKKFIRKAFSYYVSESVMKEIISAPEKLSLGGVRREMTVLFSDVAGFTTISEKIPAEDLANLLNQYLTRMTRIIFEKKGVLDKFIGDAVMAFWNAPLEEKDHAYLACQAAIMMQEEIHKIKQEWEEMKFGEFEVRIGINTGGMVVGNMGSDMRFDYTVLGDNVNLGSRLEGVNKEYGTQIIISKSTYEHVKDRVTVRYLDKVAVKGKLKGVGIYELRGLSSPSEEEKIFIQEFEAARELYQSGSFKEALNLFELFLTKHHDDKATKVYIARCEYFIKSPPQDWDGIYHLTTK